MIIDNQKDKQTCYFIILDWNGNVCTIKLIWSLLQGVWGVIRSNKLLVKHFLTVY